MTNSRIYCCDQIVNINLYLKAKNHLLKQKIQWIRIRTELVLVFSTRVLFFALSIILYGSKAKGKTDGRIIYYWGVRKYNFTIWTNAPQIELWEGRFRKEVQFSLIIISEQLKRILNREFFISLSLKTYTSHLYLYKK